MLLRFIRAAGLKPWAKLFQNMRSTRQTELSDHHPAKAVCQWMGNSLGVANKHYLQVTDEHFEKAIDFRVISEGQKCDRIYAQKEIEGSRIALEQGIFATFEKDAEKRFCGEIQANSTECGYKNRGNDEFVPPLSNPTKI